MDFGFIRSENRKTAIQIHQRKRKDSLYPLQRQTQTSKKLHAERERKTLVLLGKLKSHKTQNTCRKCEMKTTKVHNGETCVTK